MPAKPNPERDKPTKLTGDPEQVFKALMQVDAEAAKEADRKPAKPATREKRRT